MRGGGRSRRAYPLNSITTPATSGGFGLRFSFVAWLAKRLKVIEIILPATCLIDDVVNVGGWRDTSACLARLAKITIALKDLGT